MSSVGRARAWLRAVVMRRRLEREMHEEMAAHLAQAAERFRTRGMSEHDAMLAAKREFGQVAPLQESARDARGGQWVDHLARDVRYALRYFARTPLTTVTIILTLGLGIGFSGAVFSVINGILTRPAPGVPDDPALVKIRGISPVRPFDRRVSYPELAAYAALTDKFESVGGWLTSSVVVDGGEADLPVVSARAYFATPNYFRTLRIRLAAGRGFDQSRFDDLAPPELTAIVSHAFATARFGEPGAAVGKQVRLNDVLVTILGVAPPNFNGVLHEGESRTGTVWLPLSAWPLIGRQDSRVFTDPNAGGLDAFARLRPGVTRAEALPSVRVVAARADVAAKAQAPREWTATADIARLRGMAMQVTGRYQNELGPGMALFGGIALLILLVCTTTVNSLLIGTAVARRYEIGVRLALGASRARVIRQLLTEIAIMALAGGALGGWAFGALARITEIAQDGFDVSPTWSTVGFTMLYALLTATLCGLSPALHATRAGLSDVLKDSASGAKGRSRLQRVFVIAQIAVAQPLMIGLAALLSYAISELTPLGSLTLRDRVVLAELDDRIDARLQQRDRVPELVEQLSKLAGVSAVLPIGFGQGTASLEISRGADTPQGSAMRTSVQLFDVPPGYFRAVDAPIVRGREFAASDTTLAVTPVIMAESLAVALFTSSDPIGQRLRRVVPYGGKPSEVEVIGVVRMTRANSFMEYEPDFPAVFVPFVRRPAGVCRAGSCYAPGTKLLIRTSGPAEPLVPSMTSLLREQARTMPLTRITTLAQHDRWYRQTRAGAASAAAICGAIALVLASVGLYGMVSIAVGQRRREIGVRIALGAHSRQVVRMFFASGLRATLVGIGIGLPVSIAALIAMMRALQLPWNNAPVLAAFVTLAVVGVASLASWLPARRAASVNPIVVLRTD